MKAETFQTFDDVLYVRLARSILAGEWLGPYDHLTLTKNPFYPLFLALNHALGTPLLLVQSALYAGAGLVFAREVRLLGVPRALVVALYAAYLFNPFVEIRVMREGIYSSLLVLMLAPLMQLHRRMKGGNRALAASAGLGITLSCGWLTREEGALLLPAIALVLAHAVVWSRTERRQPRAFAAHVATLAVPFAILVSAVGAVSLANLRAYGVLRVNEQSSGPFSAAFGSLMRVRSARKDSHLLVPYEARRAIYRVSPAFASIEPFLDGTQGSWALRSSWVTDTCALYPPTCPDYAGTWTMWASRQAAADAGWHREPRVVDAFYGAVSAEIDHACRTGALGCGPARSSIVPPIRRSYLPALGGALLRGLAYSLTVPVRDYVYDPGARSVADPVGLELFRRFTNDATLPSVMDAERNEPLARSDLFRLHVLRLVAGGYQRAFSTVAVVGLAAFCSRPCAPRSGEASPPRFSSRRRSSCS